MATADELKISLNNFFTSEDANTIAQDTKHNTYHN